MMTGSKKPANETQAMVNIMYIVVVFVVVVCVCLYVDVCVRGSEKRSRAGQILCFNSHANK